MRFLKLSLVTPLGGVVVPPNATPCPLLTDAKDEPARLLLYSQPQEVLQIKLLRRNKV